MVGNKDHPNGSVRVKLANEDTPTLALDPKDESEGGRSGLGTETPPRGKCSTCLGKLSTAIVAGLENAFYRLGKLVARNPWKFMLACLVTCSVAGAGLMLWHEETEYVKVWLPRGSRMYDEHQWVVQNFPESIRYEAVIIEDENVLSPRSINAIYDLYISAQNFDIVNNSSLEELCIKTGPFCRVNSILELWAYNETIIRSLSDGDILRAVNQPKIISPLYRNELNIDKILGDISRDNSSNIVAARATSMFWYLRKNESTELEAADWEHKLIDLMNVQGHEDLESLYIYTARTFDDEAMGALSSDVNLLSIGFSLVFIYLSFSIGKYSWVEQKIWLAFSGLLSIGLAIIFTYGIGFATGIMFGPIHQILPFMLLGIGVDDMFVIMESLRQLSPQERSLPVEERVGLMLKHAGVSITVTSVTDIVAFAIGGSTVIPSLSTFCLYAAIGVFALYILQTTYFVACVTLDERRIDSRRNACIICYKHPPDYKEWKHYNYSLQHEFMRRFWGPLLTKKPMKVFVIAVAIGLSALNIWSFIQLKHDFDPSMYLPSDSYSQRYVKADRKFFPDDGAFVQMYCDEMNYEDNLDNLRTLYEKVKSTPTVQSSTVDFWLASFLQWQNTSASMSFVPTMTDSSAIKNGSMAGNLDGSNTNISLGGKDTDALKAQYAVQMGNDSKSPLTDTSFGQNFLSKLLYFMTTNNGRVYWRYLKFDNMKQPTRIMASVLTFRHVKCTTSVCNIAAMEDMRELVDNYRFIGGGRCFVYSHPQYMFNETNKVLKLELYRNLALAAVCVFVVTLILIANFWASILVFVCVVFTVVDVAGTMQFWDISIDTASSVLLILCFGLAVDYSAHVGHTFMTHTGSRNERTKKTLVHIGPAVFSGGFSTFLAFLLLVNSISYGFTLFFRIFTTVVIFGLFHGLVFLPVILSILGPDPYDTNFLSPLDTDPTNKELNVDYELYVHRTNDDKLIHWTEMQPLKQNGNANGDIFNSDFPPIQNGDLCNTVGHVPYEESNNVNGHHQNPRYSGSYYEQLSNGSLVQIPYSQRAT
ncbi:patched domain-containing protein 3-like isoform X1 [Mya arenaria]|uniref:patched domain-containing protein 3-like isoform X1 n=2 Tax=Mya arenaria TaxID=6604 RepID=UPI0022E0BD21|nr:patched domain-containing protein 3-like isoform X1 [Mya arenaria]XP_052775685.1 patched domain-containing protein 3-like isoform X1 [Mya arenaria]XP_052775686.1 patched domain-containing protein 3-like isoform X1 [Mya arenaria]XP_052775687.1 patched domain-containing protein 3-like isoform X1 [Mya arenaria]